ncbi:hypothetical protein GCM10020254_18630 [Streptomyces goshikiensis]
MWFAVVFRCPMSGLERAAEEPLHGGHALGDGQRGGDRPVLRHQLADDHQDDGRQRGAEDQGGGGGGAGRQSHRLERALQQGGDRGLGDHADDQAGHGDAELRAGELERQAADGDEGALRAPLAALDGLFELAALHGRQRELRRDEDSTGEAEQQRHDEQEHFGHRSVTSVP